MRGILSAAIFGLTFARVAVGQETDESEALCQTKAESDVIHIAICAERGTDEIMGKEGERICDGDVPCGVWFWLSAEDAPDMAPDNHDGLTQAEVTSAIGVYVKEDDMFIRIDVE